MRITSKMLESPSEADDVLALYIILVNAFAKENFTFFGGIVRDLMVPMTILSPETEILSRKTIGILLQKIDFIDFNDIDLWLCEHKRQLLKDTLRTLSYYNLIDLCTEKKILGYNDKHISSKFTVISNNVSVEIDVISNPSLHNIDFDVNNLCWDGEFNLIDSRRETMERILDEKISKNRNSFFGKIRRDEDRCIEKIVQHIMDKKAVQLSLGINRVVNSSKLISRLTKMVNKNYCFESSDYKICSSEEYKDDCGICFFPLNDEKLVVHINISEKVYHPTCIFKWWDIKTSKRELITECPLRNKILIWN